LATVTIDAAKILGLDSRIGSLVKGKDADLAMYDGDPFEYTTHCTGTIINGQIVSETIRYPFHSKLQSKNKNELYRVRQHEFS
jgi:imidazolonepropionase-like amidohydrolase